MRLPTAHEVAARAKLTGESLDGVRRHLVREAAKLALYDLAQKSEVAEILLKLLEEEAI